MPKNYQISQYDLPICVGGRLDVELPDGVTKRVGITRVHMEEDTGKTEHGSESGRIHDAQHALVDYNRAGVPLVECVSEPDIRIAGRGGRLPARAASHAGGARRVRREDGGGVAPLRRQRLAAAGRDRRPRHEGRDQEHELDPFARACAHLRDRAADESAGERRADRPGDTSLGRGRGRDEVDALQGGGVRLSLLPRAGHPGARARATRGSRRSERPSPSCRVPAGRGTSTRSV